MSDADKRNLEYWNNYYADYSIIKIEDNNWLNMYNDVFDKTNMPIIDLGCGNGNNLPFLLGKGRGVIPCDGASTAIRNVEKRFPGISAAYCFNMLDKFPLSNNMTDLIVSDLSLHYFTGEDTIKILEGIRDKYEAHHNVKITDEAIKAAVDLSVRYINDRFLPDKAIDLIDEAASKVRMRKFKEPNDLKILITAPPIS